MPCKRLGDALRGNHSNVVAHVNGPIDQYDLNHGNTDKHQNNLLARDCGNAEFFATLSGLANLDMDRHDGRSDEGREQSCRG